MCAFQELLIGKNSCEAILRKGVQSINESLYDLKADTVRSSD